MRRTMKALLGAAALLAGLSGCLMREGNYRNVEAMPHEWVLPGPETEVKVFGPMPFEEVKDFVREKESEGWGLVGYEPATLPEDVMVHTMELDQPSRPRRAVWTHDIPKTMDDRVDPPPAKVQAAEGAVKATGPRVLSIPPYLGEGVKGHRQKYLVILRRWL